MDPNCEGCIHYRQICAEYWFCCNYIFDEDHRRPCPPGAGCTVKSRKRRRKKQEPGAAPAAGRSPEAETEGGSFETTVSLYDPL